MSIACAKTIGYIVQETDYRIQDVEMKVVTAQTLTDSVASALRNDIVSLALKPGEPLGEADLARRYGVSTTPVREALQRLSNEGLVVLNRYRGAAVVRISAKDVWEIYDLRQTLEPHAVRLAVPRFTDADIAHMAELLSKSAVALKNDDLEELSSHNREFHEMFMVACGNSRLRGFLTNLQSHNRLIALNAWKLRGFDSLEQSEHALVFEAVRQRDGNKAADLLGQHIARFGQAVVEIWPESDSEVDSV